MGKLKNYMQSNNHILNIWKEAFVKQGGDENRFSEDGIMYMGPMELYADGDDQPKRYWRSPSDDNFTKENTYWENCPVRFLYLTKDQNGAGENGSAWDSRMESYCDPNSSDSDYNVCKTPTFNKLMAYTVGGLVSAVHGNFIPLPEIKEKQDFCIRSFEQYPIARINCKKELGGCRCQNSVLNKHISKYGDYLIEQINNLDADVFICCEYHETDQVWFNNGFDSIFVDFLADNGYNFTWKPVGKIGGVWIDEEKRKIAIRTYHLAYRVKDLTKYTDIVEIFYLFCKENPDFFKKK